MNRLALASRRLGIMSVSVALLAGSRVNADVLPAYRLTPIPYLPNGTVNSASWINDAGVVVGSSNTIFFDNGTSTGTTRAFRWSEGSAPLDLGAFDTAPQNTSAANSVNNLGQIVGSAKGDITLTEATLFRPAAAGGNLPLGRLGDSVSFARSINEAGQIVGYTQAANINQAFIYENGQMRSLLGRRRTTATGINESGQISGSYNNVDVIFSPVQAFRARADGTFVNLGTLGGSTSFGNAINDAGDVVGSSTLTPYSVPEHAFLAPGNGGPLIDLGTLGSTSEYFDVSVAAAINNHREIVGGSYVDHPGSTVADGRPFVVLGGMMLNLQDLKDTSGDGWILGSAASINDAGQIVGRGINPAGNIQSFLLTPTRRLAPGDATLDGTVNFDDLLVLAQHYGQSGVNWRSGDFNVDFVVDFADLLTLAQHYPGASAGIDTTNVGFQSDWAIARSFAPEPTAAVMLWVAQLWARRRTTPSTPLRSSPPAKQSRDHQI